MGEASRDRVVLSSLIWKWMELVGVTIAQLGVQVLLARLLAPADFGVIALAGVFIAVANIVVVSGLGTALVQKKTVDQLDLSSVFFASIAVATAMFALMFLISGLLAHVFENPELAQVVRILSAALFLSPLNVVQNALIARGLLFKKVFLNNSLSTLLSGLLGVLLAIGGYGLWALVFQQISNQFLRSALLWASMRWRPSLEFSWIRLRGMISFSWKMLASGLIDSLYNQARTLIIGAIYPLGVLGYYTRGQSFPSMIVSALDGSIQAVMLPVLSSRQDDRMAMKATMRRAMIMSSYVVFPAMAGLAAVSDPLVRLLLTEKWVPAVPYLQIFCGVFALWPVHTANLQAVIALGRSDVMLRLEVIKKIIGVGILALTIPLGPLAMAAGELGVGIIASFVNGRPNAKLLDYRYREQLRDLAPIVALSAVMGVAVWAIDLVGLSAPVTLSFQLVAGFGIYVVASWLLRLEPFIYSVAAARDVLGKKGGTQRSE